MSKDRFLDHLRSVPLLANCTKQQLQAIGKIATDIDIPAGTVLMAEGSAAHEFVIIMSGQATVKRAGRKIATLGPNDVVGELALLAHRPRNATVVAETDMEVLVVQQQSFTPLLDNVPGLARKLLSTVAERLADTAPPKALLH
jgi:CRP-like cAMP-binding protein